MVTIDDCIRNGQVSITYPYRGVMPGKKVTMMANDLVVNENLDPSVLDGDLATAAELLGHYGMITPCKWSD